MSPENKQAPYAHAEEFQAFADEWDRAARHHSSIFVKATHPAYQKIIQMGPAALPLILQDLQRTRRHWFWALCAITGEGPVPQEDAGNVPKMTQAWLDWGRERG